MADQERAAEQTIPATASREIVPAQHQVDPLAIIGKRNRLLERLVEAGIRATAPTHWTSYPDGKGGRKYRLTDAGVQVVARRCAVSVEDVVWQREEHNDDKGEYYEYVAMGTARLPGGHDYYQGTGTCSSRDNFLGTETNAGRELSEVEPGSILKAAIANMRVNTISGLLGLKDVPEEVLRKYQLDVDKVPGVDFKSGSRGGGSGREFTFAYGTAKGKTPQEATEAELQKYIGDARKQLSDPEKAKYRKNNEALIAACEKVLAGRANTAAGAKPAANGGGGREAVTMRARIATLAQDYEIPDDVVGELVKKATSKAKPSDMNEEDFAKIEKLFSEESVRQKSNADDISY